MGGVYTVFFARLFILQPISLLLNKVLQTFKSLEKRMYNSIYNSFTNQIWMIHIKKIFADI